MKGLVIVALGAILIWFGLSSGGSDVDASETTTTGGAEPLIVAPPAGYGDPPPDLGQDEDGALMDPAGDPAEDLTADTGQDDVPYEEEVFYEAPPAVPEVVDLPEPVYFEPAGSAPAAYDDDFTFTREATGDATRLGSLLLEAWIAGEASDLLTYLQEGDGADLPVARQQLVAAFWEAAVGEVDVASKRLPAIRNGTGVSGMHLALLSTALDPPGQRAVPSSAASGRVDPLAQAMQMVLLEDEARILLRSREYGRSAVSWSDLVQLEIDAPWAPHREALLRWGGELGKAQRNHRFSHRGQWPAEEIKVQRDDSLTAIRQRILRRRPDMIICTGLIREVNNVGKYVHAGDLLRIPTDRANLIIDLDARVVLYRHGDEVLRMWECGIGKEGSETPLGVFYVGDKISKPAHTVLRLPYGHKDNPLGSHWITLLQNDEPTSYGIHGTREPNGVGGAVSAGCIRLRNADVGDLSGIIPVGAEVVIQQ